MASDHSEEDYIDMEISSYADMGFFSTTNSITRSSYSFNNPREFEFQMCPGPRDRDRPTTSPADELFYKGKLLPLHLPPRLQMVEKLLNSRSSSSFDDRLDSNEDASFDHDFFSTPLMTTAPTPTATRTPFESCNISPSESFRISGGETNTESVPAEHTSESSDKRSTTISKKHRSISLGSKLKASRAYLRSFFGSSGCSSESSTAARKVADEGSAVMHVKASKKNSLFGQNIPRIRAECELPKSRKEKSSEQVVSEDRGGGRHRRSFSLALRRHSATAENKSSTSSSSSSSSSSGSSSFSSNSNWRIRDQFTYLKRCGSANYSEIESSIEGAIAHCNQSQSQKMLHSRNSVSASIS